MTKLPDISEHFHIKDGFCYPEWYVICDRIEECIPETERNSAWEVVLRSWLGKMRDQLGGDYQVYETENFIILSAVPNREMKYVCRSFEDLLKEILANLPGVAMNHYCGKHVVMLFESLDQHYRYIKPFYPEGECPRSHGVCIYSQSYTHFAVPFEDYSSYRTEMVHELTRSCLMHLPMPVWLIESLAMRMQQVVCGSDVFLLNQELYDKHKEHWDEDTIQKFWSGESWGIPDDFLELSYNLSQVLWRKIEVYLAVSRQKILQFITEADYQDGGEAACQSAFDLSLADIVMDFLGDGNWAPDPNRWPKQPTPETEGVENQ